MAALIVEDRFGAGVGSKAAVRTEEEREESCNK
jgi:hypothetical protein